MMKRLSMSIGFVVSILARNRRTLLSRPRRSFSMNLMKSRFGGFGRRPIQEQRESSSLPQPLYGGHSLDGPLYASDLYDTGVKFSVEKI